MEDNLGHIHTVLSNDWRKKNPAVIIDRSLCTTARKTLAKHWVSRGKALRRQPWSIHISSTPGLCISRTDSSQRTKYQKDGVPALEKET